MTKRNQCFLVSLFVLLLLLLCCSAERKGNFLTVNRESFIWADAEESGRCSAAVHTEKSSLFSLMHIKSPCSPFRPSDSTWYDSILESIERDSHRYNEVVQGRVSRMSNQPLVSSSSGNYIVKLGFGTPAQSFYTVVDTASDLAWIPCTSCSSCQQQNTNLLFDPSNSSTYEHLHCIDCPWRNCNPFCTVTQTYADGSESRQLLSKETLTVGAQTVPSFTFSCASDGRGVIRSAPGLVGFGRDSLSFVSQTNSLYDAAFSYCLPSLGSSTFTGSLRLGKSALFSQGLSFTPLLNNSKKPSFYYVGMIGFSVGNERVRVPPGTLDIDRSTGRGTILDSGTVITRLAAVAYRLMRDSFRRQASNLSMASPVSIFDTCYNVPASGVVEVPQITLNFQNGLEWPLPPENYLFPAKNVSVLCLAFAPPPGNSSPTSLISIIGTYQQQNFRVVHDVPGSRIGVAAEKCSD